VTISNSVATQTAGMLRGEQPAASPEQENEAFEQAMADATDRYHSSRCAGAALPRSSVRISSNDATGQQRPLMDGCTSEDMYLVPDPPEELLAQAQLEGRTHWWPPDAAMQAIEWYRAQQIAFIGVDLAYLREGKIYATLDLLDMSLNEIPTDWSAYVDACAAQARAFIESRYHHADAYFDLTAISEEWQIWWNSHGRR